MSLTHMYIHAAFGPSSLTFPSPDSSKSAGTALPASPCPEYPNSSYTSVEKPTFSQTNPVSVT